VHKHAVYFETSECAGTLTDEGFADIYFIAHYIQLYVKYHISLLSKYAIIETLGTHPLHWQFHRTTLLSLTEVVLGIDILSVLA